MPAIPGDDPDVLRLQAAARTLAARGLTAARIANYVTQALVHVALQLPATFRRTHDTAGLPGFPAIDCFADAGTDVHPPEDGELVYPHPLPWNLERRSGGWTCYYHGASGDTYFLTHFGRLVQAGHYRKTDVIGAVGKVPRDAWPAHIHEGKHRGRYNPPRV